MQDYPIVITIAGSCLVEALWVLAVARTLERRGKKGMIERTWYLVGLCVMAPVMLSALMMGPRSLPTIPPLISLIAPGLFFATPFLFGAAAAITWKSRRPLAICAAALVGTLVLGFVASQIASELARGRTGTPVFVGMTLIPCALWHLCSGPALMMWAQKVNFPAGMCHVCRYDLAGLPASSPCPECGTVPLAQPENSANENGRGPFEAAVIE